MTQLIKEQSVSLVELFYDLIYVYAIASMTSILGEGELGPYVFVRYFAASFIVLQAWMYMTNYINRFGREKWYENAAIAVNMFSTIFLANAISAEWEQMFLPFNISLIVNLGTVFVLYSLHVREGGNRRATALYSMKSLAPALCIYTLVALFGSYLLVMATFGLDMAAILCGIFLPAIIRTGFDSSIISFPHLAERFELLVIITFGESIVTMAGLLAHFGFAVESFLAFGAIIALFGSYVVQMHNLVEHHARHRALLLIYSHFLLVICLNLFTVAFNLVVGMGEASLAASAISAVAVIGFFACLFSLRPYYREGASLNAGVIFTLAISLVVGTALTLAGHTEAIFLIAGAAVSAVGCFFALLYADKRETVIVDCAR